MSECYKITRNLNELAEHFGGEFQPRFDRKFWHFSKSGKDNQSCWSLGFDNGDFQVLLVGDFSSTDNSYKYVSKEIITSNEKRVVSKFIKEAIATRDIENKNLQDEYRELNKRTVSLKVDYPVGDFEYFSKKQIDNLYGGFFIRDERNEDDGKPFFVVPARDADGVVWNYQRIYRKRIEGRPQKKFMRGKALGLFHVIGDPTPTTYLCEGFATGVSIHRATGCSVIVCFGWHGLIAVCKTLKRVEGIRYIVCADNDCWPKEGSNPKLHKNVGLEAARQTNLKYVYPTFDDGQSTDFNDLYCLQGPQAVSNRLSSVVTVVDPFSDMLSISEIHDEKYQQYATAFEKLKEIRSCRKDFLTDRVMYWNPKKKCFESILNKMESIRSICDGASLDRARVSDNVHRHCETKAPQWLFEVPVWDGKDRIGWMCDFVKPSNVSNQVFENFMKSWFANIFMRIDDNTFHNFLPILLSPIQGLGKSHWVRVITSGFGCYYGRAGDTGDEKNILMTATSKLVVDFDEFDKFYRLHPGFVKNLITTNEENFRMPYERHPKDYQMRASFIGSCNRDDFLRDTTGNRRFVVFTIESIDHSYGKELPVSDRLQIVAQAKALYDEGYQVTEENKALMAKIVQQLSPEDPMESALDEWELLVDEAILSNGRTSRTVEPYIRSPQASQIWDTICRRNGIKIREFQAILKRTGRTVRVTSGNYYYPRAKEDKNT